MRSRAKLDEKGSLMKRASGILMHISSLPSPYGVGSFGKEAYRFVDFLSAAKQKYWQILPLGPTSYGDSPYQSFSTFAGNPYFIDLDALKEQGLLYNEDFDGLYWGSDPEHVDYGALYNARYIVLRKAFERAKNDVAFMLRMEAFERDNDAWLEDFSLFMAIKSHFGGKSWQEWDDDIRLRDKAALAYWRLKLLPEIKLQNFIQLLFYEQWEKLKSYAGERGIHIIGDLPIYVPLDSADVWSSPEEFQLDSDRRPTEVAGVPPDYFTADGQLWGNPLYRWDSMGKNGYAWWMRRIARAGQLYDVVRIDHFRGLAAYWAVEYGSATARIGRWITGPDMDFISTLKANFPNLVIIAEDLGVVTSEVVELVENAGFPNMKVLEFAFDSNEQSNYLPHNYEHRCVCYTGTHDNTTVMGWASSAKPDDLAFAKVYAGDNPNESMVWSFVRLGMSSTADLFVAQMQDYLELGDEARMNFPGTLGSNWQWRMKEGAYDDALASRIARYVKLYNR